MKIRAKAQIQIGDVWEWDRGQVWITSITREDLDNGIEENIVGICCKKSHRNVSVGFAFNYTTEEFLELGHKLIERNGDPIKQEPENLIDRIKALYTNFEVVELYFWENKSLPNSRKYLGFRDDARIKHIEAQSMKGFNEYVYHNDIGSFYTHTGPVDYIDKKVIHPVAALFSRVEG